MRALVRRVHEAEVIVNDHSVGAIKQGLLVYLGICRDDEENDIEWIAKKILGMRIFDDSSGLMNLPISESKGIWWSANLPFRKSEKGYTTVL